MAQRDDQARRVLDRSQEEADRFGHRYLGPEHLVLGVLRDGGSGASRALEAHGVDLPGARAQLRRLVELSSSTFNGIDPSVLLPVAHSDLPQSTKELDIELT